jgi:hypothetical protein
MHWHVTVRCKPVTNRLRLYSRSNFSMLDLPSETVGFFLCSPAALCRMRLPQRRPTVNALSRLPR